MYNEICLYWEIKCNSSAPACTDKFLGKKDSSSLVYFGHNSNTFIEIICICKLYFINHNGVYRSTKYYFIFFPWSLFSTIPDCVFSSFEMLILVEIVFRLRLLLHICITWCCISILWTIIRVTNFIVEQINESMITSHMNIGEHTGKSFFFLLFKLTLHFFIFVLVFNWHN